jgi:CheY-like chemotaxis protein
MPDGGTLIFETEAVELGAEFLAEHPYSVAEGRYLQISVTDTGHGMTEEVRKHLFEPFFTTKPVGKGTGMGLAAVYGTVRSHKGTANVCSETGHGTTVRLYLPLPEPVAPDAAATQEVAQSAAHYRILVAEDEPAVRDLATDVLEDAGHSVLQAANGREAVALYRQHWQLIDLVILDMVMPEMSGRDTFRALKEINPAVRVLLASGFSVDGEAQSILDDGVRGFLQKPFLRAEMVRQIAEVMKE